MQKQNNNVENNFNTVEEAIEALKSGQIIIVSDDEDRENEGDLVCASDLPHQKILILWQNMAEGLFVYR